MRVAFGSVLLLVACGSSGLPKSPEPLSVADGGLDGAGTADTGPLTEADGSVPGRAAGESREDRRIAKMMKRVAAARGLAALRPVPGVVLDRDALIAKVKSHVDREVPPEAIRHEGLELQLFGFLPTTFDYEAETFKLLEAQLAGFYEPADGTMYMAADLDGANAEATLAHELDHSLQDQHFDLKPHAKYEAGKSDQESAFDALAEGDATSAMADVLIARASPGKTALDLPEEAFAQSVIESVSTGATGEIPHLMRTSLVAPYVYGTLFVNAIRRSGGWGAVDQAWQAFPTTTEQILHVEKWRAREPALEVSSPAFAALGAGWRSVDVDTSGELGMRLAFEEWMGAGDAAVAAGGWGGDRALLLEDGAGHAALAMRVRYDATKVPRPAAEDPFTLVSKGFAKLGKVAAAPSWSCVERAALGPLAALKHGRDLVLVVGPATVGVGGAPWKAAGDCAQAKKWATEVAAAP